MVSDEATAASRSARDALARSWALVLGVGVVTFLLGVTLAGDAELIVNGT